MPRSFGLVDNKVQEAEYFLDRILSSGFVIYGLNFDTVAFVAAARSITFAMQSSLTGISEFDNWYATKQEYLKTQPLCSFFNRLRRVTQHIGGSPIGGGCSSDGEVAHYFAKFKELGDIPEPNVAVACEQFYKLLLELVYECYLEFNPLINSQWRLTKEHFRSRGLTIEDAEEELGLPRGWSGVSVLPEDIRWKYLRKEADGCNTQQQFERWLGKRVPHPDDEV
ncbi:hypothetical protein [Salinicola salarius]|uniref:hypothetical protein n=1 Tax=Salinicola salarius TaxID=430457 RepID=UPI00117B3020|nr:hypothetical protein [Salinicola salarius]